MSFLNDRILGVLMLLLAVAYGWQAQQIPVPFGGGGPVGPSTFPTLLAVVLGLTSLYLMLRPDPDNAWPLGRTLGEMLVAVLVLIAYTLALEPIGFPIATTLAVGILCWRMGARPLPAFLVGLGGAVIGYIAFNFGLELTLPAGLLEFH
ncbi:tripartite tricarboxylate transporter TctB family protein [Kushneria phosphatilytica]|uniref:Tripartite tricarboxylate transporter TctB family protein n=1 Tax=Kushneria phosphatilytica TaxID=657387 RepID=A0A1S1P262_9GAMM|nr:tripartite tricarboxylate transporter TctB family protein [Kushneria phosphatilytica]OHV12880.1 tricarboxylic transporter [Kushneria phosphatilytica]QEL10739.1 tripartite tricarboxylate transporter TctB family protein [Kushneria phosphatilytica]